MKKLILCCLLTSLGLFPASARGSDEPVTVPVVITGTLFELELALTPKQRERGLMERTELEPERGMLFVFPEAAERQFWMKNTRLDLDIVYLDSRGRVVSFMTMPVAAPRRADETEEHYEERLPRYPSGKPARFAIEFRAGTLSLLDLHPGQAIPIDVPALLQRAK